jgi:hypothetical protein
MVEFVRAIKGTRTFAEQESAAHRVSFCAERPEGGSTMTDKAAHETRLERVLGVEDVCWTRGQ